MVAFTCHEYIWLRFSLSQEQQNIQTAETVKNKMI